MWRTWARERCRRCSGRQARRNAAHHTRPRSSCVAWKRLTAWALARALPVLRSGVTLVGYVTSSITNIMSIRNAVSTKTSVKKQAVQDVLKSRQVRMAG